jgi:hypothetical protein
MQLYMTKENKVDVNVEYRNRQCDIITVPQATNFVGDGVLKYHMKGLDI